MTKTEKRAMLIKKMQAEIDRRTELEEEAIELMSNGEFEKATDLLKSIDDGIVKEIRYACSIKNSIDVFKGREVNYMFHKRLKEAMKELNINQTQLSNLTGIGKSSISQYVSGKNIPEEKRRREMAIVLGLEENYFEEEMSVKVQINREAKIPRLLPCDVADIMGLSPQTIRSGLQQGVFPWGYAIKTSENQWTYFINARSFSEKERVSLDIDF